MKLCNKVAWGNFVHSPGWGNFGQPNTLWTALSTTHQPLQLNCSKLYYQVHNGSVHRENNKREWLLQAAYGKTWPTLGAILIPLTLKSYNKPVWQQFSSSSDVDSAVLSVSHHIGHFNIPRQPLLSNICWTASFCSRCMPLKAPPHCPSWDWRECACANFSRLPFFRGRDDRTAIDTREISVITGIYAVSMLVSLFSL